MTSGLPSCMTPDTATLKNLVQSTDPAASDLLVMDYAQTWSETMGCSNFDFLDLRKSLQTLYKHLHPNRLLSLRKNQTQTHSTFDFHSSNNYVQLNMTSCACSYAVPEISRSRRLVTLPRKCGVSGIWFSFNRNLSRAGRRCMAVGITTSWFCLSTEWAK